MTFLMNGADMPNTLLNTAVLGTGLLGLDLIERINNSPYLQCGLAVARTPAATGCPRPAR